jgi:hypothetical protein
VLGIPAEALSSDPAASPEVLDRSRRLIAETYGVSPAKVRIMIEL